MTGYAFGIHHLAVLIVLSVAVVLNACSNNPAPIQTPATAPTVTSTPEQTAAPTVTPADTRTPEPTNPPTIAPTASPVPEVPTPIPTPVPTATRTPTPTATATPTPTPTPTATPTPTVVSLEVAGMTPLTSIGETVRLSATANLSDGSRRQVESALVQWQSSDPWVASVSEGTVTAVGGGNAMITAAYEGRTIDAPISVRISGSVRFRVGHLRRRCA